MIENSIDEKTNQAFETNSKQVNIGELITPRYRGYISVQSSLSQN